ncbi:MAG: hypothetical protein WB495_25865 [Xanthobacteraceae bacterium]
MAAAAKSLCTTREEILAATITGTSVDEFETKAKNWLDRALLLALIKMRALVGAANSQNTLDAQ